MSLRSVAYNLPPLAGPSDSTLSADPLAHLKCDDDEPTRVWERPEFFGEPCGRPYPADQQLPARVAHHILCDTATRDL